LGLPLMVELGQGPGMPWLALGLTLEPAVDEGEVLT